MTEIVPSETMAATRRVLDLDYAMEVSPTTRYGAAIAAWLPRQLPGRDIRNIGWGLLLLAAMLTPEKKADHPVTAGMRFTLLSASQVGDTLIGSAAPDPAAEPSPEIGQEMAELRPMIDELWNELPIPPQMMDIEQAAWDAVAGLDEGFPAADVPGTGWAALGTGMVLARDVRRVHAKAARGLMLPRSRRRKEQRGQGAIVAALTLARVGDRLISQD